MSIVDDILASYRRPRQVIARKLADGPREDRALATAMGACAMAFVAQWPSLSRAAALDPSVPLQARMGAALLASVFLLPLILYALSLISHGVARAFGGKGSAFASRMALFWAMLAIAPLMLLHGLTRGFLGDGLQATALGALVLAVFLWMWLSMLMQAHKTAP
jgi:hypothetical protein